MKTVFKIFIGICGLFILIFAQCRKKNKTPHISNWLEKEYPNRFQVVDTYTKDVIGNLSFSVKESVVAEKSNPSVQAKLGWDKRMVDLTLSRTIVDGAFLEANREYNDAQSLYKTINANGLKDMAVSVKNGMARVLIFAEPTFDHRQNSLEILEISFAQWRKEAEYDININYLEPTGKDKEFKEIVPLIYWVQSSPEFMRNLLYTTTCPADQRFVAKEVAKSWEYSTSSSRFLACIDIAKKEAHAWASKNIKRPITLFDTTEFSQVNEQTKIVTLKFPFAYQSDKEQKTTDYISANGSIRLDFNVDKKIIVGPIKLEKE